jgi:3-oxoacyl-[acyl-carrier protein] reductase
MENSSGNNRVAIVTGGSRGIGRAIVEELAHSGWRVAFTYSSSAESAAEIVKQLHAGGFAASAYQADVRSYQRAREVTEEVEKLFGPIDLLVNNAGIKRDVALYSMDPAAWADVIETNMGGTFNYCRNVVFGMMKRKAGAIVNIVSVSGIIGLPGQTNYSASKAGVIGFTKALAKEVARFKIRVNAVAPGLVQTDMLGEMPEEARKRLLSQVPLGTLGSPEQVAKAVMFLAGEDAGYITGQVLPVDGGMV